MRAITNEDLSQILSHYDIPHFDSYAQTQYGIQNVNFYIETSAGRYVLTVLGDEFAQWTSQDFSCIFDIIAFLYNKGIPTAPPLLSRDKTPLRPWKDRFALLTPALPGFHVTNPLPADTQQIGCLLGHIHSALREYGQLSAVLSLHHKNIINHQLIDAIRHFVSKDELAVINRFILARQHLQTLHFCAIHGDPFPDNILFQNGLVTGIIDFWGISFLPCLTDLARAVLGWCITPTGILNRSLMAPLLLSYNASNPLPEKEWQYFYIALACAATELMSLRIYNNYIKRNPRQKDPRTMLNVAQEYFRYSTAPNFSLSRLVS